MIGLRVAILGIATLAATSAHAAMRLYNVDESYREEVVGALRIINVQRQQAGQTAARVAELPNGQILVDANDDLQSEIAAILEAIESYDPGPTPSVMLRYWILLGASVPVTTEPAPPILDNVVMDLQAAHGNLSFTVLEAAALVSEAGYPAESGGDGGLQITQQVRPNDGGINADLRVRGRVYADRYLAVNVTLEPGEFLVLGESTVEYDQGRRGVLAFVVHWPAQD